MKHISIEYDQQGFRATPVPVRQMIPHRIIDKLHKQSVIHVQKPDHSPDRAIRSVTDAVGNAMLVTGTLLRDADVQPGDELIVDVRILITRESNTD